MKLIDALSLALDMLHEAIGQLTAQDLSPEETAALYQLQAARLRLTDSSGVGSGPMTTDQYPAWTRVLN